MDDGLWGATVRQMASDGFFFQGGGGERRSHHCWSLENYISRDKLPALFRGPQGSTLTPTHQTISAPFFCSKKKKNGADNGGASFKPTTQIVTAVINRQVDKGRR